MYSNWNERSASLRTMHWYHVDELIAYLHELRQFIIVDISDTTKVTEHLPRLQGITLPATKDERFPQHKYYLCEGIGEWNFKLDLLNLSVHVMMDAARSKNRMYPDFKTVGEAEVYAMSMINKLLMALGSTGDSSIVTQDMFERKYELVWAQEENGDDISSDK